MPSWRPPPTRRPRWPVATRRWADPARRGTISSAPRPGAGPDCRLPCQPMDGLQAPPAEPGTALTSDVTTVEPLAPPTAPGAASSLGPRPGEDAPGDTEQRG